MDNGVQYIVEEWVSPDDSSSTIFEKFDEAKKQMEMALGDPGPYVKKVKLWISIVIKEKEI